MGDITVRKCKCERKATPIIRRDELKGWFCASCGEFSTATTEEYNKHELSKSQR